MTDDSKQAAIKELAKRLYWNMDRLDPDLSELTPWAELRPRDRRFYRLLIEDLARYVDLWTILTPETIVTRNCRQPDREGTAADIGCVESYSCQSGKGDPPMDCIWPDCSCGTLVVKPEYRQPVGQPDREAIIEKCAKLVDAEIKLAHLHAPDDVQTRGCNAYAAAKVRRALQSCAVDIRALKRSAISTEDSNG